jgi:hypothetical protein
MTSRFQTFRSKLTTDEMSTPPAPPPAETNYVALLTDRPSFALATKSGGPGFRSCLLLASMGLARVLSSLPTNERNGEKGRVSAVHPSVDTKAESDVILPLSMAALDRLTIGH